MSNELEPRYKSVHSGLIKKIIEVADMTTHHNIFLQPRYVARGQSNENKAKL